jgi:predicted KAP-like P-loop ATPase
LEFAVVGKWKTTLLKYLEKSIKENFDESDNYRVIHFNPWASAGFEDLQRDLLETLIKELQKIEWKQNVEQGKRNIQEISSIFKLFKVCEAYSSCCI